MTRRVVTFIGLGAAAVASAVLGRTVIDGASLDPSSPLLVGPVVALALFAAVPGVVPLARAGIIGLVVAVLGHQIGVLVDLGLNQVASPPAFDIGVFWIEAKVAMSGQNFYDPTFSHAIGSSMGYSEAVASELFFWYPPPTMLLYLALGMLDLTSAAAAIYLVSGIAAVACTILLWRLFLHDAGPIGLLSAATLLTVSHPAITTVFFGQSNYLVLLFVLLFWSQLRSRTAGIWFVLANVVKPVMLPLALLLVARQRRSALGMAMLTLAALGVASLLILGGDTTFAYLRQGPQQLAPDWLYQQDVNQSLLAVVLRATGDSFALGGPVTNYLYLNLAAILAALTAFICLRRGTDEWTAVALLVTLGLLIYPGTLEHYYLVLIPALLLVWHRRHDLPGSAISAGAVVAVAYVLMAVLDGQRSFVAALFTWIVLVGLAVQPALAMRVRWARRRLPPLRDAQPRPAQ